jgi:hypothetical protein
VLLLMIEDGHLKIDIFFQNINTINVTYEAIQIDQNILQVIDLVQYQPKDPKEPQVER